jgi:hypothetical protein
VTTPYGSEVVRPYNVLAIISFVLAFVVAPGAIVCGHIARRQIRTTGEQGDGLALAGLILGYVFTAGIVLFIAVWLILFFTIFAGFAGIASQIPSVSS